MAVDERKPVGTASTAELVSRAAEQISTLVRDELALARAELMTKGKRVGMGGGLFGAAGVLALYGLGLVLTLAVVLLDIVWPLWAAVLLVLVAVFLIAGLAALIGRAQIRRSMPAMPQEAVAGVATDVDMVKHAVREGRHK